MSNKLIGITVGLITLSANQPTRSKIETAALLMLSYDILRTELFRVTEHHVLLLPVTGLIIIDLRGTGVRGWFEGGDA